MDIDQKEGNNEVVDDGSTIMRGTEVINGANLFRIKLNNQYFLG
jgi:hypothetical protein